MDNEYRNPIVDKCIQELKEGKPFLKGMKTTVKVMLVNSSPELRQALLERASEDTLFLAKLPPEVIQILLRPTDEQLKVQPEAQTEEQTEVQPEAQSDEQTEMQPEAQSDEQSEVQLEDQSSFSGQSHHYPWSRRDWDPFTVYEDTEVEVPKFDRHRYRHSRNTMKPAADNNESETDESTDTESENSENDTEQPAANNDENEHDETTDTEEDNALKNFIQKLTLKKVSSVIGILLSLPLVKYIPLGPIAILAGIIPLVSGIIGDFTWRNAFRPLKLTWLAISLILSTQLHWLFSLALLVDGILVLKDEKLILNTVIPAKGTDKIIWRFTTLNRLGMPIPWRVFTVERSGDILRITNTTQIFGGDNSQGFLYLKDPEIKSTFAEAVFGDYQYVTMKDTSHDNEDLSIRLPRPVVTAISKSQLLRRLCELAKSPAETTVVTHNHI